MEQIKIDIQKSVYELCSENPQIITLLEELGFHDITKPGLLNTAGRFMTIKKGASLKKIDFEIITQAFRQKGYQFI